VERPRIILGLGNPGTRYRETRHNMGFRVADRLAERWCTSFELSRELKAWVAETHGPEGRIVLAKPRTYMNRSGRAAVALCGRYACDPSRLLVVYDDADLELGRVRLRPLGGAGGHNGMRSIIDGLQTERFPRVRLGVRGVARGGADLADYVLLPFDRDEHPAVAVLVDHGADAVQAILEDGLEAAMNIFNARCSNGGADGELEGR